MAALLPALKQDGARNPPAVGSRQQKLVVCLQVCAKDACCTRQCKLKPGSMCSLGLCCEKCQVRCVCLCWEVRKASR